MSTFIIAAFIFLLCLSFGSQATIINVTATNQIGDVDYVVNGNCSFHEATRTASRNETVDACPAGQP